MTEAEKALYDAHEHRPDLGGFAGECCLEALHAIDTARKAQTRVPTLFDEVTA